MAKYIVHSSIDENGKIAGGQAGDQTKKEVCIRAFYDMLAEQVFRIQHEEVRNQFAKNMIDCANNDNVGYDQYQRNGILTEAEKVDFNFAKIKVKCESDCSSVVTACFLGAIYKVLGKEAYKKAKKVLVQGGNCATTSTLKSRLKDNGVVKVKVYTSNTYTRGTTKAVYGDIYNKPGNHVFAYIEDGEQKKEEKLSFKYRVKTKEEGWLAEVTDLEDYAGVRGHKITNVAIGVNLGSVRYQVHTVDGKWLPEVTGYDTKDQKNGYAGNGTPIDAIRVYYETPKEYAQKYGYQYADYRVSPLNKGYFPWQRDDEISSKQDGYAGTYGKAIDRFQLW